MYIFAAGLNYKTAPVEIREKLAISQSEYNEVVGKLLKLNPVYEICILSTCNRVELYGVIDNKEEFEDKLIQAISEKANISEDEIRKYIFFYYEEKAIRHIFKVASSLDSMVIGEPQIVCQFKDSFSKAKELKAVRHIMGRLFDKALQVSKKIRTSTGISKKAVSISYAAVQLAKKIFGDLSDKNVLLIGAGEMAELAARHLKSTGVKHIFVANRTFEKAVELADKFSGTPIKFENFKDFLPESDIVITSTGAKKPIIIKDTFKEVLKKRKGKPVFIFDISVPRNVEEKVNELENVYVYDIDDLKDVVNQNLEDRKLEAMKAEIIIDEEVEKFNKWLAQQKLSPIIANIRFFAEEIKEKQLEKLFSQMPYLNEKERENIELAINAIINKILHRPTMYLKDKASSKDVQDYVEIFEDMFSSRWDLRKKNKNKVEK
ncbi:glutamyl-tRNA reductase [Hydrogenothermus marinus]|uniref:Glutamyl-tRNA reductase n=1 Tax=Hydrogenothermus marinus TaxID=133270 RepID=A0A3M0BHM9_9AQUI|nr:glutamyl-tRNA reductase [Hydrogenothermus marinus]RMA96076.1 glutamyl-tRNA reductase [Hydrogenothermus marinus]